MYSILTDISTQATALMNGSIPGIAAFAWRMFNLIAVFQLIMICIRWELEVLDNHHWTRFHLSDVMQFLMKLAAAGLMLTFYSAALPGFGVSFHQLLPSIGQTLASTVDSTGDALLTTNLNNAVANMPTPSILSVLEIASYLLILMLVGLFQMLLFVVTAFGFIAVAVLSITGYLMIPLLLTKNFSKYFWNWLDQMVVYSMYPFIAAAFTFVLGNSLNNLVVKAFASGATLYQMMAYIPALLVLLGTFAFAVFRVPAFTSQHFGGAGGVFSNMAEGAQAYATKMLEPR